MTRYVYPSEVVYCHTFEDGKKWWIQKERDLETAYTNCKVLPHKPDEEKIKDLLLRCLEQHYGSLDAAIQRNPSMDMLLRDINEIVRKYGG